MKDSFASSEVISVLALQEFPLEDSRMSVHIDSEVSPNAVLRINSTILTSLERCRIEGH